MDTQEKLIRERNLNAHIAWSLVMWGSADVAREEGNYLLAPIGYYYAVFHAGFALANTNHTIRPKDLSRVGHSQLEKWLESMLSYTLVNKFNFLREIRETINYLGVSSEENDAEKDSISKLNIVRGHKFGFKISKDKNLSFFDSINKCQEHSHYFLLEVLKIIEDFCNKNNWRGPKIGDDNWETEYLQEDLFLHVIPSGSNRGEILSRAFSFTNPLE